MTRKDYVALASIVHDNLSGVIAGDEQNVIVSAINSRVARIARDIAAFCAQENTRFDAERFLQECGLTFADLPVGDTAVQYPDNSRVPTWHPKR